VAERFAREAPYLKPLPTIRFDTSYREQRGVGWDGYIDVRGNRYSVPDKLCGAAVVVHIGLDGVLKVYDRAGQLVARHLLKPVIEGWSYEPGHHRDLWQRTLPAVERRPLEVYEEVARCS